MTNKEYIDKKYNELKKHGYIDYFDNNMKEQLYDYLLLIDTESLTMDEIVYSFFDSNGHDPECFGYDRE